MGTDMYIACDTGEVLEIGRAYWLAEDTPLFTEAGDAWPWHTEQFFDGAEAVQAIDDVVKRRPLGEHRLKEWPSDAWVAYVQRWLRERPGRRFQLLTSDMGRMEPKPTHTALPNR